MYELALFAGAGGGILGGILCGHTIVGAVEIESYPREVLKQRQRDGILDRFPIWDDVTTFRIDNPECREYIEALREIRNELVISGGFPCQDISSAGKGAGIKADTRSGLWFEFSRIISEIQPARVFVENSPLLISRGLDIVLSDLAEMGYNARWGIISAENAGAPHQRKRIWIVANASKGRCCQQKSREVQQPRRTQAISPSETITNSNKELLPESRRTRSRGSKLSDGSIQKARWVSTDYWSAEPAVGRVAHGVACRVDRLKAIGNGQVPAVVKLAWGELG